MHPSYQMNGHPYQSSPSPFHQPAAAPASHNGHSPQVGPGMPAHAPYPYAVHHPPYPPHGYPSYPQYPAPSSMMMYGAAGPSHGDAAAQQDPSPSPAPTKRKRKYSPSPRPSPTPPAMLTHSRADSTGDAVRPAASSAGTPTQIESKKRTKTQRACDSCRSRKIRCAQCLSPCTPPPPVIVALAEHPLTRCDVLADADPPVCQHCKQYGFDCTFFLPITETRFKKKRLEEEAEREKDKEKDRNSTASPNTDGPRGADVRVFGKSPRPSATPCTLITAQARRRPRTCCTRKR